MRFERGRARSPRLAGGAAGSLRRRWRSSPEGTGGQPGSPCAGSDSPARGRSPVLPGCPLARSSRDKIISSACVAHVELPFGILPVPARGSVLSAVEGGNGRRSRVAVLSLLSNFKVCQCALLRGGGEGKKEIWKMSESFSLMCSRGVLY